jgi:hypothetical protein
MERIAARLAGALATVTEDRLVVNVILVITRSAA